MTTRADALRDLIAAVEAGATNFDVGPLPANTAVLALHAIEGSLDAVARLEAGLRERGWRGPQMGPLRLEAGAADQFSVSWWTYDPHRLVDAIAPTEARARLLAVLRALLSEQPRDPA